MQTLRKRVKAYSTYIFSQLYTAVQTPDYCGTFGAEPRSRRSRLWQRRPSIWCGTGKAGRCRCVTTPTDKLNPVQQNTAGPSRPRKKYDVTTSKWNATRGIISTQSLEEFIWIWYLTQTIVFETYLRLVNNYKISLDRLRANDLPDADGSLVVMGQGLEKLDTVAAMSLPRTLTNYRYSCKICSPAYVNPKSNSKWWDSVSASTLKYPVHWHPWVPCLLEF